jgi:hypothetical protein
MTPLVILSAAKDSHVQVLRSAQDDNQGVNALPKKAQRSTARARRRNDERRSTVDGSRRLISM